MLKDAEARVRDLLRARGKELKLLAEALMERETLDQAQIKSVLGARPVYLTFDIDALDPAYAPGTGTPVWGGLTSAQAAMLLRDLAGISIIGGDIVEVSPPFDTTGATAIAGAHIATELLCLIGANLRGGI